MSVWLWIFACTVLDPDPPEIRVVGPKTPVRLSAGFQVTAEDAEPGLSRVELSVDDNLTEVLLPDVVPIKGEKRVQFPWVHGVHALKDGEHQLVFTAVDASWRENSAAQSLTIVVDTTPPQLDAPYGAMEGPPGGSVEVRIRSNEPLSQGLDQDGTLLTLEAEDRLLGVFQVPEEGSREIAITAVDLAGNEGTARFTVRPSLPEESL